MGQMILTPKGINNLTYLIGFFVFLLGFLGGFLFNVIIYIKRNKALIDSSDNSTTLPMQQNSTDTTDERLRLALESSASGVWEIDIAAKTVSFDDQIKKILDYDIDTNLVTLQEWNNFLQIRFTGEDYKKSIPLKDLGNSIEYILYISSTNKYIHCFSDPVFDDNGNVIKRIGLTMDVTEREQLLSQLQSTKESFNIALQSSNAGYWEIPLEHNENNEYVIHYEENFAKLFKIPHINPFTTTEWSDYLMPILDPVEYADFHRFLRNFEPSTEQLINDIHLCFPDGSELYLKNSAQFSYDRHGNPDKMIGLCVDFTESIKSLECANKISETLLNSMKQMIYVADINTDEVIFVNDVMIDAFDIPENYVGKKYWELFTDCSIASVTKAKKFLDDNPNQSITWELYQPYLKKELSCVARYITWIDGRKVCFRTYFDISSLKKAERYVQEQLEQQKVMATIAKDFIQADNPRIVIENSLRAIGESLDCYRTILSLYNSETDKMGNDYEWFNPSLTNIPRDQNSIKFSDVKDDFNKVLNNEVPYAIIDSSLFLPHLKSDQHLKSILFVPFHIDGQFAGFLEVMKSKFNKEWTESEIQLVMMASSTYSMFFSRQRIAENLVKAMTSAENANNAKTAFLSNMSHEIRTPLNAIIGMTNIALKDSISESTEKYLNNIKNASDILLNIINNVLDMSKIEAAKLELTNDYFELDETLENIKNIVSVRSDENHQQLIFFIDDDVPNTYFGDSFRLTQIIMNILYNAIKFSHEYANINLHVKLDSTVNNAACLKFEISDQGVGMTPAQISQLFKPFEQGDNRTVRKYGGTGLGLAISKQLAELMSGTITVESELGVGSIFTLMITLNTVLPQLKTAQVPNDIPLETLDLSHKHILIVEDVAINRDIVKFILEYTHVSIDEAENGLIAVDLFNQNPNKYDLILMDIQMPALDGYSATKMIREIDEDIPIIAMTAHAFKEDEEKSLAIGMNEHINKPINEKILIKTIAKYIL